MAEASLDLIQTMLQRVLDTQSRHGDRFRTVNERLAAIDKNLVMIRQRAALGAEATTLLGDRLDSHEGRLDRLERRLELRDF